jgi:hypothetical protein
MSTYYFVLCEGHMERSDAASKLVGGNVVPLADSDATLLKFLVWHKGCRLRVVDEHADEVTDEGNRYTEWTEENVNAMFERPTATHTLTAATGNPSGPER